MTRDPIAFLDAVSGYTQEGKQGSADRPIKLATIDPAYVASSYPGTLPKVTFDGESTLSGKRYVVLSGYLPRPSDRVVMLPVGNTYVILGTISVSAIGTVQDEATTDETVTASYAAGTEICGVSFVAPPSGKVIISVSGFIRTSVVGNQVFLSYEVRQGSTIGSGTVQQAASDTYAVVNSLAVVASGPSELGGSHRRMVSGLTAGSSYNARTMHRGTATNGGVNHRVLLVEPVLA